MQIGFAQSALNPYSVALGVLPASFVLKFFLACGRHMFPGCRKQRRIQAIALDAILPHMVRLTMPSVHCPVQRGLASEHTGFLPSSLT
jgi:hypothetical protein